MRRLLASLAAALLLAAPGRAGAETTRLTILHTTDLHGSLAAWDDLNDRPANRGLEKLASLIGGVRAEGHPVLLLDAGDAIEGSPLATVYHEGEMSRPDPVVAAMNRIGYDAMAVGNHEFSFGLPGLERARREAHYPWLAANVVHAASGAAAFDSSVVKVVGGVRIGIVGLTTPAVPMLEDSSHWAGLAFRAPVEVARREIERLRSREHCDVVVLLAHTGFERDPATGAERRGGTPDENWGWRLAHDAPGADVILLGHTHVVIPSLEMGGAVVAQAGKWAENLGRVDLDLARPDASAPWKIATHRATMLAVRDSTPADTAIAALVKPYHDAARFALDETVGRAATTIGAPRGVFDDGPLWEMIQDAQLAASGADVSLAALPDPTARIAAGKVTRRDLMRIYPYENTLVAVELSGAELKATLEKSAEYLSAYTYEADRPLAEPGMSAYNFDAAEGVGYEIDLTRPVGDRILNLTFKGHALAPDQRLKVVVSSYRANGGGGFETIRRAPRVWSSPRDVRAWLADRIHAKPALDGGFTRNWRLLPDYAATPERPLIDRLVRQKVVPREEVLRLEADEPARRGDLAYWLARVYGWREKKLSGAFADVPDSLEPWLDGLLKRKVLGSESSAEEIQPFAVVHLGLALDWCAAAAKYSHYAVETPREDAAFRAGLTSDIDLPRGPTGRGVAFVDTLTRAQVLGIVANARFPRLRVLETTDLHGVILPPARDRRTNRVSGGSPVLAAWIEKLRAANPAGTILLDGGDLFQGTMISNLQFGRPVIEQMNALHYDAAAIGNHDFDWSVDTLRARLREARFHGLGANLIERSSGKLPRWARADTLLTRNGVRVGVFGLCFRKTPEVTLAANVAAYRFEDDSTTAVREIAKLRGKDHAQVVIEVGHVPAETDSAHHARKDDPGDLPRDAHVPGADLWLGGHSHNLLDDRVNGVPMMIAGAHGQTVGVCDLAVDPVAGRVVDAHTWLQTTWADEVTPDSAMAARVERWNAGVAAAAAVPIGRAAHAVTRGSPESPIGDLVADAMRERVRADVAMQNTGGLRAELAEGVITKGAIFEVMPFDNTIYVQELNGAEVKLAIEQALRTGRVTQVSGVRFTYDSSRPELDRVTKITLADGSPLDPAKSYKVACNNFMATGGDSYDVLQKGSNRIDTGFLVREAMETWVAERCKNGAALDVSADGRIVREGGRN